MSEEKTYRPEQLVPGEDGVTRSAEREFELNDLAAATFKTKAGQKFLNYLKNVTINAVTGPHTTDTELRHLEGQRFIVAVIQRRIENGRSGRPNIERGGAGPGKPK
jgi:glutathione synthase/RimK-type ligase-like ATP-grasp enzyme